MGLKQVSGSNRGLQIIDFKQVRRSNKWFKQVSQLTEWLKHVTQ